MARAHDSVDAVVVGMGWAGSILAAELSRLGMTVVGLERGPVLTNWDGAGVDASDELRFVAHAELAQDPGAETWTLRHDHGEPALPLREGGSSRPGEGVGGSGVAWGGVCRRWLPHQFRLRSTIVERFGASALPPDSTIDDWPLGYSDLEPYYDRFEQTIGTTGVAGNIGGRRQPQGNPFEGPRSRDYPMPPLEQADATRCFGEAARRLGLHPYPQPTANSSRAYTNPDGITRGACTYCGRCAFHPCAVGAKASPLITTLPVAHASGRFELRDRARVFEVVHQRGRACGVRYHDAAGDVHEQRAGVVALCAYTFGNVRLLLLSRIGAPYDPTTGGGVVGRNYTYQGTTVARGFFPERRFEVFRGANGVALCVDDFSGPGPNETDPLGGSLACRIVGGPLGGVPLPPGTPAWGREWKHALRNWSGRSVTVTASTDVLAYRGHYLDLDPVYKDRWGLPLLRMTYDWRPTERAVVRRLADRAAGILTEMGAQHVHAASLPERYDGATYQSTHNNGGAVMGESPTTSAVNRFQQCWEVENLFVVGASAFPYNSGHGPTGTVGALAYLAADAIGRYAGTGGMLA